MRTEQTPFGALAPAALAQQDPARAPTVASPPSSQSFIAGSCLMCVFKNRRHSSYPRCSRRMARNEVEKPAEHPTSDCPDSMMSKADLIEVTANHRRESF